MKGVKMPKVNKENKKTLSRKNKNKDIEELKDCMKKIVSYFDKKLRKIETLLMEIPDASHGIASKPSNLIRKVANTIAWFDKFRK